MTTLEAAFEAALGRQAPLDMSVAKTDSITGGRTRLVNRATGEVQLWTIPEGDEMIQVDKVPALAAIVDGAWGMPDGDLPASWSGSPLRIRGDLPTILDNLHQIPSWELEPGGIRSTLAECDTFATVASLDWKEMAERLGFISVDAEDQRRQSWLEKHSKYRYDAEGQRYSGRADEAVPPEARFGALSKGGIIDMGDAERRVVVMRGRSENIVVAVQELISRGHKGGFERHPKLLDDGSWSITRTKVKADRTWAWLTTHTLIAFGHGDGIDIAAKLERQMRSDVEDMHDMERVLGEFRQSTATMYRGAPAYAEAASLGQEIEMLWDAQAMPERAE